jgi:large subunit ribosomal protein L21
MQAVIETGGKQYKVAVGRSVNVEKLPAAVGERVELDRVLMVFDDAGEGRIGRPVVEGAKVIAKVTEQDLGPKEIIFRYRAKKRERVKKGHRQPYTRLLIEQISLN